MPVERPLDTPGQERAWPAALFLTAVYLLSTGWGFWWAPIANPDEPRYACAARDMAEGAGRWLVPTFNGMPRINKPPLIYWALAVCGKVGTTLGLSMEAALRLAPLLAGLATVLSVYGLGRRLFSHRAGFFAGMMLIATPFIHTQWREIDTDPFLTAALTAAWYFFVAAMQSTGDTPMPSPSPSRTTRTWTWALCAYVAMGVASLAKGPFLLGIFFLLPAAAYLLWRQTGEKTQRRIQLLVRLGVGWGLPLALLIGVGWNLFLKQADVAQGTSQASESLRRFLGGVDHNEGLQMYPWLMYLVNLPHQCLPWSLFLLPLIPWAWRNDPRAWRVTLLALAALLVPALILRIIGGAAPQDHWQFGLFLGIAIGLIVWTVAVAAVWVRRIGPLSDRTRLLVCAVAIPFLIMGIVGSKRNSYLLPVFPFLTLWVAHAWDWVLPTSESAEAHRAGPLRAWNVIAGLLAVLIVLVPVGIALTGPLGIQNREGFSLSSGSFTVTVVMAMAMAVAAASAIRCLRANRPLGAAQQLLLMAAAGLFVHAAVLQPALDRRENRPAFYGAVSEAAGVRPLVWLGGTANEAVYYCRRSVKRLLGYSQIDADFFQVPGAVMVVRDREFDHPNEPGPSLKTSVRILIQLVYGKRRFYLVEARPDRPPASPLLKGPPPPRDEPDGE